MAEEKESASPKLDALLERIPIMDGGGRRRLTAGTIVLIVVVAVFTDIWPHIKEAIASKDVSLSLIIAVGALLIYAMGVLVELVGEIFLARAVANAVWAYVDANHATRQWRRELQPVRWVLVVLWGSIRAVGFFVIGLFGGSRWRMRFRPRLSKQARIAYDKLPVPVRLALKHSLGWKAEFGRMALVEGLHDPRKRRWARAQLERPKDVLTLVSALVMGLLIFLVWSPLDPAAEAGTIAGLLSEQAAADKLQAEVNSAAQAAPPSNVSVGARLTAGDTAHALRNAIDTLKSMTDPKSTVAPLVHQSTDENIMALEVGGRFSVPQCPGSDVPSDTRLPPPELKWLSETWSPKCDQYRELENRIFRSRSKWIDDLADSKREHLLVRSLCGIAALFLYIAFFNTLSSVIISVVEAIGLEHASTVVKPLESLSESDLSILD